MRAVLIAVVCACGASSGPRSPHYDEPPPTPITVEWKVEQGAGDTVNVSLVVDGRSIAIGILDAATEHEAGSPATCAMRAASSRRTEIICGDVNGYVAELVEQELVISFLREQRTEMKRVPVAGDLLAVKMLSLPLDEDLERSQR